MGNFKKNATTMAIKTTGVVFGVPHFILALTAYELSMIEGAVVSLIKRKNVIRKTSKNRSMSSNETISMMELKVSTVIEKTKERVANARAKTAEAFPS